MRQKTLLPQLHFALLRPAVRNYALKSAETAAGVWRFFDLVRGSNHVVCVDLSSVLIKWTRTSCVHFSTASEVGAVRRTASIYPRRVMRGAVG